MGKNLINGGIPKVIIKNTLKNPQNEKTLWAQRTALNTDKTLTKQGFKVVNYFKNKNNAPSPPQIQWKEKRLIVIFTNPDEKLNSELMKNQINNVFKMANVNVTVSIIVKTIMKSKNIVIKTIKNNNTDDLIKHQHI